MSADKRQFLIDRSFDRMMSRYEALEPYELVKNKYQSVDFDDIYDGLEKFEE